MTLAILIHALDHAICNYDLDDAHEVLQQMWNSGVDCETAKSLLRLLSDSVEQYDIMFGIIHVVERAAPADVYSAIAAELSSLAATTLRWAEILVARQLAGRTAQGNGFDANDFLTVFDSNAGPGAKAALRAIVASLKLKGKIDQALISHPVIG